MKIGIVTLPLHTNYGGILQAYALQTVLERLGHQVEHLQPKPEYPPLHAKWMMPLVWLKRIVKKYIGGDRQLPIFKDARKIARKNTDIFIHTYIKCKYLLPNEWNEKLALDYDAVIFGSDQIWRPIYAYPIERYFGDFIGKSNVRKIAYAASFGTEENEYTDEQLKVCSSLLKSFKGISVREDSGIQKCQKQLGVLATHVLDPTMLLNVTDYMHLLKLSATQKSSGTLAVYILDECQQQNDFIKKVAKYKGLVPFRINSKIENNKAFFVERIQPPVESWIRAFYDADFIITDSFHACVFSIIFQKPFICVGNKDRGMSRFHSLLKMYGIENRLVDISHLNELNLTEISWNTVDAILSLKRKEAVSFLNNSLT